MIGLMCSRRAELFVRKLLTRHVHIFFQLVARPTRETDLYSRNGETRTNCFFVVSRQHEIEGIIGVQKVISFTTASLRTRTGGFRSSPTPYIHI